MRLSLCNICPFIVVVYEFFILQISFSDQVVGGSLYIINEKRPFLSVEVQSAQEVDGLSRYSCQALLAYPNFVGVELGGVEKPESSARNF